MVDIVESISALAKSRHSAWFEPFTNNTSWDDRRPCAVTFDGMTGFDMGPDDWWDTESSLYARPWKVKAYGGNTWIARAKEDWSGWDLDWYREWFQLPEEAGEGCEFDLTFDQNSRPFVCWETDGKIWIHYYDPVEEDMHTKELCSGRTPRAKLDVRRERLSGESDIILFYINDDAERVEYRLQRDRYDTPYVTDLATADFDSRDSHNLGGDAEGADGAFEAGAPTDNDDYYTFDGTEDGLVWDGRYELDENGAIRIRFRAHDKNKGTSQCLWSSGGAAIGFDSDGNLGVFDGIDSITVDAEDVPEDQWLEVECDSTKVTLFDSDTLDVLAKSTGSVAIEHVGTYEEEEEDSTTGSTITQTYEAPESVAYCSEYSPIRGTEDTGDYFDGDIDWIQIGIIRTRYDVANMYLELLYMSSNFRLYLFFSQYDPDSATYSMGYWHSAPYPYVMENEEVILDGDSIRSAAIIVTIHKTSLSESAQLDGDSIQGATVASVMLGPYDIRDEEISLNGDSIREANRRVTILSASLSEDEEVSLDGDSIQSGNKRVSMLENTIEDESIMSDGDSIQSAIRQEG